MMVQEMQQIHENRGQSLLTAHPPDRLSCELSKVRAGHNGIVYNLPLILSSS